LPMPVRKSESGRGSTPVHPENLATKDNDMDITKHFSFEGKAITTQTDENGLDWFSANDVVAALGYANPSKSVRDHVDDDDLTKRRVIDNMGRNQVANFVNESGLYSLILRSNKPEAKRFKRWVTNEVLPSIRKDGATSRATPRPSK